jgi:uridine kinase
MNSKGVVVGISGPSGSGKSSIAEQLSFQFVRSHVISLDSFFRTDLGERESWDSPECIDFPALEAEMERCAQTYQTVLVEGFVLFHSSKVQELVDKAVILRCSKEVAMARRLHRDRLAVNDPANTTEYFEKHVWPAHEAYETECKVNVAQQLNIDAALPLKTLLQQIKTFIEAA